MEQLASKLHVHGQETEHMDWLFQPAPNENVDNTPGQQQVAASNNIDWLFQPAPNENVDHTLTQGQQQKPSVKDIHVDWLFQSAAIENLPTGLNKKKPGRKSISSKHPEVVQKIKEVIEQSSTAAHARRRDDTAISYGVSRKQIKQKIKADLGLDVSVTTIHRMMIPPNKQRKGAQRYKSLVNAKVPPKSNNLSTKDHGDFHYTSAHVNLLNEMAEMYRDEVLSLSCDDKNKLNIGIPAVSRHIKYQGFFDAQSQPDLPDHDFPLPNSKITPSGYMVLGDHPNTKDCEFRMDDLDRKHVQWKRIGEMNLYLQSDTFLPSTSQMHLNHLLDLIPQLIKRSNQSVVTILCDGGPDWRTDSPCNIVNFGRLWRDLSLDGLFLTSYAPYHSRYNPIERAFSNLSKWLVGVTFPAVLPGEERPPQQQNITQAEKEEKLTVVHDNAIALCSQHWGNRDYHGNPITVHCVPSSGVSLAYRDHTTLAALTSAPLYDLKGRLLPFVKEYRFFMKHLVRTSYQIQFFKCMDRACEHCVASPIKARKVESYLNKHGGRLPLPNWSIKHDGHYQTFLDTLDVEDKSDVPLTEDLPSCGKLTGCKNCQYIPASNSDAKRHERLVHRKLE